MVDRVAKKLEGKLNTKQVMHFWRVLVGARDALTAAVVEE